MTRGLALDALDAFTVLNLSALLVLERSCRKTVGAWNVTLYAASNVLPSVAQNRLFTKSV